MTTTPVAPRPTRLPFALALLAGIVDTTSFLTLGGLFAAHITGNLVLIAASAAGGDTPQLTQLLAIPLFIAVSTATTVLVTKLAPSNRRTTFVLLIVQALLLCAAAVVVLAFGISSTHGTAAIAVAVLAVSAMASQNALLHLTLSAAPSTAVMTGNLVTATVSLTRLLMLRNADTQNDRKRFSTSWPLIAGFVAGCALAALSVLTIASSAWIVCAAIGIVIAVVQIAAARNRVAVGV